MFAGVATAKNFSIFPPTAKLMAADVKASGRNFTAGAVHALFEVGSSKAFESYDVTADAQRFIVVRDKEEPNEAITLFANWDAELKKE
jgi:predicted ATP-grasp superfamily ATP-dependent carboligase